MSSLRISRLALVMVCWTAVGLLGLPSSVLAWTLPEHAYLSRSAARTLSAPETATWQKLWDIILDSYGGAVPLDPNWGAAAASNRVGHYSGVPSQVKILSFSDLPALAGDHSCSPAELGAMLGEVQAVLRAPPEMDKPHWLQRVIVDAAVSCDSLRDLGGFPLPAGAATNTRRDDNRDDLNFDLTIHDKAYIDRASANYAHFQLPRLASETLTGWLRSMTSHTMPLANAAAYGTYHGTALALAREFHARFTTPSSITTPNAAASKLALDIVLNEAFALHFLEDAFAAGHFTDFRPESPFRNGIHDAYSRNGSTATPWSGGAAWTAHGDSYLAADDVQYASVAIHESLAQIQNALEHGVVPPELAGVVAADVSVCTERSPRVWLAGLAPTGVFDAIKGTPKPTVAGTDMPRYRNDRGLNLQAGLHLDQPLLFGSSVPSTTAWLGELGLSVNFDSIMAAYRDGNLFQLTFLGGGEKTNGQWSPAFGFHARVPWLSLVISSFAVAFSDSIAISVPQFAAMVETRSCSWAPGPWTSALTLNKASDFSMFWSDGAWTIRAPVLYYQLRAPRPLESRVEPFARLELGANVRVGRDANYYGAYVDLAPMMRILLTNLGPK
jgi:hypothetical protein